MLSTNPIIFFDGHCNLCNGFVDFLIKRDRTGVFFYASLQGNTAIDKLPHDLRSRLETIVLLTPNGELLTQSAAVLWILKRLSPGYQFIATLGSLVPEKILDFFYRLISKQRYSIWGKRSTCRLPSKEEQKFFLP